MVDNLLQVLPCHLRFGDNALNIYNFIIDEREQAKKESGFFHGVGSTENTSFWTVPNFSHSLFA